MVPFISLELSFELILIIQCLCVQHIVLGKFQETMIEYLCKDYVHIVCFDIALIVFIPLQVQRFLRVCQSEGDRCW